MSSRTSPRAWRSSRRGCPPPAYGGGHRPYAAARPSRPTSPRHRPKPARSTAGAPGCRRYRSCRGRSIRARPPHLRGERGIDSTEQEAFEEMKPMAPGRVMDAVTSRGLARARFAAIFRLVDSGSGRTARRWAKRAGCFPYPCHRLARSPVSMRRTRIPTSSRARGRRGRRSGTMMRSHGLNSAHCSGGETAGRCEIICSGCGIRASPAFD